MSRKHDHDRVFGTLTHQMILTPTFSNTTCQIERQINMQAARKCCIAGRVRALIFNFTINQTSKKQTIP